MNDFSDPKYGVYIRTNEKNCVINVNSDVFLTGFDGWQKIDEGYGDRYAHAQGNYLDGPLNNVDGIPRYKWDGERVIHRTEEEIETDRAVTPAPPPSVQEQLRADVDFLAAMAGVTL